MIVPICEKTFVFILKQGSAIMYVKKMCGYITTENITDAFKKGLLDYYSPPVQESRRYKNWIAVLD